MVLARRRAREESAWQQRALQAEEQALSAQALLRATWLDDAARSSSAPTDAPSHPRPLSLAALRSSAQLTSTRQIGLEAMMRHAAQLVPQVHPPHHAAPDIELHSWSSFLDTLMNAPSSDLRKAHCRRCMLVLAAALDVAQSQARTQDALLQSTTVTHLSALLDQLTIKAIQPGQGRSAAKDALLAAARQPALLQLLVLACARRCAAAVAAHAEARAAAADQLLRQPNSSSPQAHNSPTTPLLASFVSEQRAQAAVIQTLTMCADQLPHALQALAQAEAGRPPADDLPMGAAEASGSQGQGGVGGQAGDSVGPVCALPLLRAAVSCLLDTLGQLQRAQTAALGCKALQAALLRLVTRLATLLQQAASGAWAAERAGGEQGACAVQEACLDMCLLIRQAFQMV